MRQRKLDWKTGWLVYNIYLRCNNFLKHIATVFGIRLTTVHTMVYVWVDALCETLAKFFPAPTRSQMLRAYSKNMIKKFGCALIYMLLDATNIGVETMSMKTSNTVVYSAYKHGSTMKQLAACDPIGAVADPMIGSGHGTQSNCNCRLGDAQGGSIWYDG